MRNMRKWGRPNAQEDKNNVNDRKAQREKRDKVDENDQNDQNEKEVQLRQKWLERLGKPNGQKD